MLHYLHHMIFEPVSAWEKAKFDLFGVVAVFALIALVVGFSWIADKLRGD